MTLKASPAPHFSFAGWSGACVGLAPQCFVSLVSRLAVKANFLPSASIAVAAITGLGKVEVDPSGVDCSQGCAVGSGGRVDCSSGCQVVAGATMTLHAVAELGQVFVRWGGACEGSTTETCRLVVQGGVAQVAATFQGFVPAPPRVTAILGPPVTATTTTTTTTTATTTTTTPPHAGISLNVSPHTQTVNVDVNPTARFTILVENTGGVTLKNVDVVIDRSSCRLTLVPVLAPAASATYACTTANVLNLPHITVTVRASPISGGPDVTAVADADVNLVAPEISGVEVALPVSSSLARGGRLTSMPTGIKCGQGATQCSIVEPRATAVELHASAAPGWRLLGWSNSSCGRHTDCTFLLPWPGGATAFFCAKADAKVCRRPAR